MKRNSGLFAAFLILLASGYFISAYFDKNIDDPDPATPNDSLPSMIARPYPMPDHLVFAGEEMPLDDIDLRERYDREIMSNAYFHSNTIILLKKSGRWFPIMKPILEKNNIPPDFVFLPVVESGLANVVSPKKAVGFWQLTEGSARELGLTVNAEIDERYDPVKSTEAACIFLNKAKEKFGTWTNAAAAYNMGMHALNRSMEMQKMDSYYNLLLNEETSRYIFRILALKEIFQDPEAYGFYIPKDQYYQPEAVKKVEIRQSVPDFADFALAHGINYKLLKRYNPWLRTNHLTLKEGSGTVTVEIPVNHHQFSRETPPSGDSLMIGDDRQSPEE